jgi:hypothetical protein
MSEHSHVEIDETDPEGTHLWVSLHNHDGTVDTIVGQYLKAIGSMLMRWRRTWRTH